MTKKSSKSASHNRLSSTNGTTTSLPWFAATTLLGAFLVFQVQPVMSKCVLPWFGGTPAVWTTCMLFFQVLLFAGYLYAHVLRTLFRPFVQGCIHLSLLGTAALALPIEPSDAWKPTGSESPTLYLLWMLSVHVGLPYFVLSSTGPLIQAWLSYRDNSDRVYRLYALSNAGSLAALLSYPFLVDPLLSVSNQSLVWSLMFCLFALIQGVVAVGLFRVPTPTEQSTNAPMPLGSPLNRKVPSWKVRWSWMVLPALASTMLLVVTNHVCQNVAVVPFLWVLPLSLYLLSFIICFDSPQWYKPKWTATVTLISVCFIPLLNILPGYLTLVTEISSYMVMLLGVCLLCHGEVARLKPDASKLTQYYMLMSGGGAVGGIVVAIICPLLLTTHFELPLSLAFVTGMAFVIFFACRSWNRPDYDWSIAHRLRYAALSVIAAPLIAMAFASHDVSIASERNFFGVLQVLKDERGLRLIHGNTVHGMQLTGAKSSEPTTYYGEQSGIGLLLQTHQKLKQDLNIGVVGLGCGVLATYGRATDHMHMIEINPAVIRIANTHFSFLRDSKAEISTHVGDGRLVLERMKHQKFDVLVLDAFSSDAIPAHLLTREAFQLYKTRLDHNGVLAVHLSNNHLDLVPLVHRLSHDAKLSSRVIDSKGDPELQTHAATWTLIMRPDHPLWKEAELKQAIPPKKMELDAAPLWTDQRHNLVSVLKLW
jgi:spermidine synthase